MNIFSLRFYCIKYIITLLTLLSILEALFYSSDTSSTIIQVTIQTVEFLSYSATLIMTYIVSYSHSRRVLVTALAFLGFILLFSFSTIFLYMLLSVQNIASWVANLFIFLNSLL